MYIFGSYFLFHQLQSFGYAPFPRENLSSKIFCNKSSEPFQNSFHASMHPMKSMEGAQSVKIKQIKNMFQMIGIENQEVIQVLTLNLLK